MTLIPKELKLSWDAEDFETAAAPIVQQAKETFKATMQPAVQAVQDYVLPSIDSLTQGWETPETAPPPAAATVTPAAMPSAQPFEYVLPSDDALVGDWEPKPSPRRVGATITAGATPDSGLRPGESVGSIELQGPIAEGDPTRFFQTAQGYANAVEREYGIPAAFTLAVAANETGYGQRRYMAGDFNYHGIQSADGTGTPYRDWRPGPNGEKVYYEARQAGFANPLEGFRGFGRFLTENPRYQPALQRYQQTGDAEQFARDVHAAGYAEDPEWSSKVTSIMRGVPVATGVGEVVDQRAVPLSQRRSSMGPMPEDQGDAGRTPATTGDLTPDQSALDDPDKWSLCGPVAAVAMARSRGDNWTVAQAKALAEKHGLWNAAQGMGGLEAEANLLRQMGHDARTTNGVDWQSAAQDVRNGNPVTLSTRWIPDGHYIVLERVDDQGRFYVGGAGNVLKATPGRSKWMTAQEIEGLGRIEGALYFNNPSSPSPSVASGRMSQRSAGEDELTMALRQSDGASPSAPMNSGAGTGDPAPSGQADGVPPAASLPPLPEVADQPMVQPEPQSAPEAPPVLYDEDGNPYTQTSSGSYQSSAGRAGGGGVQSRLSLPSAPQETGSGDGVQTSTYNDPDAGGTISSPLPPQQPPTNVQLAEPGAPPTPGGNWEPSTALTQPSRPRAEDAGVVLAEDSQSQPPQSVAELNQSRRIPEPAVAHGPAVPPPAAPRGTPEGPMPDRPSLDPLAELERYGEPGRRLASELRRAYQDPEHPIDAWAVYEALQAIPFEVVSRARRELIPDRVAARAAGTDPVAPFRPAAEALGLPLPSPEELNPEGRPASDIAIAGGLTAVAPDPLDPAANAALGMAGRGVGAVARGARAGGRAVAHAVEPVVETGLEGAMRAPSTASATGVADEIIEAARPRPAPAVPEVVPEPAPRPWSEVSRAIDSPEQQAAREAIQPQGQGMRDQQLREEFGRPIDEPSVQRVLGGPSIQLRSEIDSPLPPQERVRPNQQDQISGPISHLPAPQSLNAAGGASVGAAGGGLTGDEDESDEDRLMRAGTGAVIGAVFSRSPSHRPPTPAALKAAAKAGSKRGASLNLDVHAPGTAVPFRVRAVVASTDDRAGLRWAEDMLSDAAGSPHMRENDPARPSTQSRVNTGSIANERIQNDLEPAITNAGRAGLQDELPQFVEDMHQKDILDEFYSRAHKAEMDAQNQRIADAQANGVSPATIQRMQALAPQRADAAGVKAMRTRQGSNPDMTYEAIEARLQAQEDRLRKSGQWGQLQQSSQAIWDHAAATRQRLVDAGLLDPADAAYYAQVYPHYVPTVPISHLDPGGAGPIASAGGPKVSAGSQKPVHALDDVGTSGERLNPIVALRNQTVRAERQIQQNNVAQAFAQMMDDAMQASPSTMTAGANHRTFMGGGVDVTYWANGQKMTISVPKAVADGLEAASKMSADPGAVGRLWKAAMGVVTASMTAARGSFLPVNLLRDVQDYAARTAAKEGGPHKIPGVMGTWMQEAGRAASDIAAAQLNPRGATGAVAGALTGAAVGDEDTTAGDRLRHAVEGAAVGTFLVGANKVTARGAAREYLARGGGSGGQSAHWKAGQRWYRDVLRDGGAPLRSPREAARYLGDWLQDIATLQGIKGINERTELISRTAAMRRGDAQKLSPTEAMTRGRDASYDPDRAGTVARMVNGIVPFFNATVQNAAQFTRFLKQNPVAAAATLTATVAPVMLGLEAWNRSDPSRAEVYDDIPQYVKDTGLVVVLPWAGSDSRGERPNYLWVPTGMTTPFVIGMRNAMQNLPGLEPTAGRGEGGWADALGAVIQTFSPLRGDSFGAAASNLVPQGVKQGIELAVNRDFYRGNPIATDNADERASAFSTGISDVANATGRAVGSDFLQNVRPSAVEHVVSALPAYADIAKGASDLVAPSGFKQAEDRPIQNEPFVGGVAGRFVRDTGGANLQRAQDASLSESARAVIQDAGMRPGDLDLTVPASYKNAPLTREEQLRWQTTYNTLLTRTLNEARRSDKWRNSATREAAVRDAAASARQDAATRARLPTDQQLEYRIRKQQAMKAS